MSLDSTPCAPGLSELLEYAQPLLIMGAQPLGGPNILGNQVSRFPGRALHVPVRNQFMSLPDESSVTRINLNLGEAVQSFRRWQQGLHQWLQYSADQMTAIQESHWDLGYATNTLQEVSRVQQSKWQS